MTIIIVFDTGYELKIKCSSFSIERDILGKICGYTAEGITENKMLYFNPERILCIYRVLDDEVK